VVGSSGLTVASSSCLAPKDGPGKGFAQLTSDGDDGISITGAQPVVGGIDILQGFGQETGSEDGMSWTQTDLGAEIASGTYTGTSGTLTTDIDSEGYIETLDIVSDGEWSGPGNVSFASVVAGSVTLDGGDTAGSRLALGGGFDNAPGQDGQTVPEPGGLILIPSAGVGLMARRRRNPAKS